MQNQICWIETINDAEADQDLKKIFDVVRNPQGRLDNLYQAFSLRPHTIKPADDLYRAALHNEANSLPKWLAELIGTYVAILNGCHYAQAHHGHNFVYLLGQSGLAPERAHEILQNLQNDNAQACGDKRDISVLVYVKKLCLEPENMTDSDVTELSKQGWSDGEILEIVQIVAMFSYFVRVINGLGISLQGDRIGLY